MAFKLYLYQGLWQHVTTFGRPRASCEWLSNCIFIRVFDNIARLVQENGVVVNGFQIVSLSGSLTTINLGKMGVKMLWMAFNLYLYQGLWQRNNSLYCLNLVVNGFQIVSLSGSLTTLSVLATNPYLLWMAFKLYLYQGLWQLLRGSELANDGCEWLSNCIFIRVFDNLMVFL